MLIKMCYTSCDFMIKHVSFGLFLFLGFVGAYQHENPNHNSIINTTVTAKDFVMIRILPDATIQRTISYRGICATEIIVEWGATTITLREIALNENRKRLQLIYEGDTLTDCMERNLIDGKNNICHQDNDDNFWANNVKDEFETLENIGKVYQLAQPSLEMWWINSSDSLVRECQRLKSKMRDRLLKRFESKMLGDHSVSKTQYSVKDSSKEEHKKRNKNRRSRRELFLMPGTQWCGRGSRATKYTDLGGFSKADACCRRHDTACPFYIPAFERRYGLFNLGITTLMHCTCDERFRTCLKMARTSSANLIGKIFFDYTQTKCFILKPNKVCFKKTWWGKCEKYKYRKQAVLRNNIGYSRK